ncbi:MAG: hypothetical protein GY810_31750 [Aureispira sp.]|nr:hypothetical protein [Aureispira sp.]
MTKQDNQDQRARHVMALAAAAIIFMIYTLIGWSTFLHKPVIPESSTIVAGV